MTQPQGPGVPFELLFTEEDSQATALPDDFLTIYPGDWHMPEIDGRPYIYTNFGMSRDGRISYNEPGQEDAVHVTKADPHDRWLMGLLRMRADAFMVGDTTMALEKYHFETAGDVCPWTAQFICPYDAESLCRPPAATPGSSPTRSLSCSRSAATSISTFPALPSRIGRSCWRLLRTAQRRPDGAASPPTSTSTPWAKRSPICRGWRSCSTATTASATCSAKAAPPSSPTCSMPLWSTKSLSPGAPPSSVAAASATAPATPKASPGYPAARPTRSRSASIAAATVLFLRTRCEYKK